MALVPVLRGPVLDFLRVQGVRKRGGLRAFFMGAVGDFMLNGFHMTIVATLLPGARSASISRTSSHGHDALVQGRRTRRDASPFGRSGCRAW